MFLFEVLLNKFPWIVFETQCIFLQKSFYLGQKDLHRCAKVQFSKRRTIDPVVSYPSVDQTNCKKVKIVKISSWS